MVSALDEMQIIVSGSGVLLFMRVACSSWEALPAQRPSERDLYRSVKFACTPLGPDSGDAGQGVKPQPHLEADTNTP